MMIVVEWGSMRCVGSWGGSWCGYMGFTGWYPFRRQVG